MGEETLLKAEDSQNENQAFLYQNHHPWDKPSFKKQKKSLITEMFHHRHIPVPTWTFAEI